MAAYVARVCVSSQWRQHFMESEAISALETRREQQIPLVVAQADQWRQTGHTAQGLIIHEDVIDLPLRIAGHVTAWQENGDTDAPWQIAMAALWPDNSATGRPRYPHRLLAGCAADQEGKDADVRSAVHKTAQSINKLLSQDIKVWLPELGGNWEYLYLSPDDYANRKRVPPRVKKLVEAACGKRLNDA